MVSQVRICSKQLHHILIHNAHFFVICIKKSKNGITVAACNFKIKNERGSPFEKKMEGKKWDEKNFKKNEKI